MISERYYRIGGLTVCLRGWQPAPQKDDRLPMFSVALSAPDILITVEKVSEITFPDIEPDYEEPYVRNCTVGKSTHRYFRHDRVKTGRDYAHLFYEAATPHIRHLELCDRGFSFTEKHLLACIGSEELFLRFGRSVLHSSCIEHDGSAILFSGISGIGKSTQAALWETHKGAAVRNGDRNLIYNKNGIEYACGLPYAGTSGICTNYELPIRAIIMLGQSKENLICRLSEKDAATRLLSQLPVPRWSAEDIARAMDAAFRIAANVPVYELKCLPDSSAVELLQKTLSEEL